MSIKSSGALSMTEIQAEFGGGGSISLSEYYRGAGYVSTPPSWNGGVPTSGSISMSQFYGKTKYYSGSAAWYGATTTTWATPEWVETIYASGCGGGAGGGYLSDEGCIHDMGGSGGGSSGEMCSGYAVGVSPGTTYGVRAGAGGGQNAVGQSTYLGGFELRGGNNGGSSGACSYFDNGHYNGAGGVPTRAGTYGYNGGGPGRGSRITGYDAYGNPYYGYFWAGGYGGAGWGGYGGGNRGEAGPGAAKGRQGDNATQWGGGGGGAAANFLNGGQFSPGGAGYAGFLSITW